jgi:Gluconate 2-dehydrogenase subunit 3
MNREGYDHGRPRDPRTQEVIRPLSQPGYYPDFSTLAQQKYWDAKTREVILERLSNVPAIRFFTVEEARFLEVICDHILPQTDRDAAHKIPIVPWIDKRLFENRHDGYRYADMPPDREAYRLGFQAIQEIARHLHGHNFEELLPLEQDQILKALHDNKPPAGEAIWKRMPVRRFWAMLVQDCIEVYYAHPWAWDEIGFGGPAYPRAYIRLENGLAEPWEADERRYKWEAPETSVSDIYESVPSSVEYPAPHGKRGTV